MNEKSKYVKKSTYRSKVLKAIGEDVKISENVMIRDSDDHQIDRKGYEKSKPICIGNHVWIGMGAIILKGVNVGDGAVYS